MARLTNPLAHVRVAAPCTADWERMRGDERVRFCAQCSRNVYNLSALTRRDAERLVMSAEGRLCVRFYRRADGTILTQNCPVGLRAIKRRVSRFVSGAITAVLSFCASVGLYSMVGVSDEPIPAMMRTMPQEALEVEPPFKGQVAVAGGMVLDAPDHWVNGRMALPMSQQVEPPMGSVIVKQPQRRPWRTH